MTLGNTVDTTAYHALTGSHDWYNKTSSHFSKADNWMPRPILDQYCCSCTSAACYVLYREMQSIQWTNLFLVEDVHNRTRQGRSWQKRSSKWIQKPIHESSDWPSAWQLYEQWTLATILTIEKRKLHCNALSQLIRLDSETNQIKDSLTNKKQIRSSCNPHFEKRYGKFSHLPAS